MTVRDETIAKINELPESLVEEVRDFIDVLLTKKEREKWELLKHLTNLEKLTESDFSDYLANLKNYEECLARGEIEW